MNREEAQEAINEGCKITHSLLTEYKWIKSYGVLHYKTDSRDIIHGYIFWQYRNSEAFDKDWKIFNEKEKNKHFKSKFKKGCRIFD